MNPLNDNSLYKNNTPKQDFSQIKQLYKMFNQNPNIILQQNPQVQQIQQIQQILQKYKGQNLKSVYMNMCKDRNIDPNVILNELRN